VGRTYMFSIKYYQHTKKFYENFRLRDEELHITQSAAFADFLRDKNPHAHVYGYKAFVKKLFQEWNHPHTEVYLHSIIRQFLHENAPEREQTYYQKRVQDFYVSLRFLMEMGGLTLYEGPSLRDEQKLLVKLMKQMYQDPLVSQYITERASLSKEKIRDKLGLHSDIQTIYLHHFDYIDGTRMMLFQLLKQVGYELVFYIPFQPELPELYKPWLEIYQSLSGVNWQDWECVEFTKWTSGAKFAHYLDQHMEHQEADRNDITFLSFEHPTSFKDYLKQNPIQKNVHEVIAVFEENLNIFTDYSHKEHFYASSYGQFFLALQNCKKTEAGITLSYDDYVNMITSGWIRAGDINGIQALTLLVDLHDYMDGISNFQDIMERLQALVEFQEFGRVFDDLSKEQTGRNRLKRYLSNPFRAFPYVHDSRYDLTVKQLIECTKDLARKVNRLLPKDQEKRNVQSYLLEIQRIYSSVKDSWNEKAAGKLENLFRTDIPATWEFEQAELFQLLTYYLASQEERNQNKIQNFDQLVGKTLSTEHIHVTGLSLKTFPWKSPSLPNLLNHTWLKNCVYHSYISANRDSRINALLVDYYSRQVTRYTALYALFHLIAYAKGRITLSFIEELQEHDGPSIYYTVLKELYDDYEFDNEEISEEFEWDQEEQQELQDIPSDGFEKIPDLLWLDSDFCHKKFFLNAFIEQHPIYEKDFHQQQVFATIGKLLMEQGDEEEFRQAVFPLFPQWTHTHKQNLLDTAFTRGLRSYKSYENIYYPKAMNRLQRLYSRYEVTKNWKAKHQYDHDTFKLRDHVNELMDNIDDKKVTARSGNHCRMCPYLHVCKEGEYVIDANDN
jgi:hypothetical protein